jgi:hypothetical protein
MHRQTIWVSILGIGLTLIGCAKDTGPAHTDQAQLDPHRPGNEPSRHAPANVTPGSHEDWCEEHGVPESQCTRCNPSLSAAFKATGDWCEEHGVPESHCTKCNPNLQIVRPAKTN